jgi:hypothetical protein
MTMNRQRWLLVAGGALLTFVLVVAFLAGNSEQRRLDRAETTETALRRKLRETRTGTITQRRALKAAIARATKLTADLEAGTFDVAVTQNDLAIAQVNLNSAQSVFAAQSSRRLAVQQCLEGVERALDRTRVRDTAGATAFLRSAAPACQTALSAPGAPVPVLPFDFADPFVLYTGGQYYAYATNAAGGNVQMARSGNLVNWEFLGNALGPLPPWARPGSVWAPALLVRGPNTVLYYTVREAFTGRQCLSVAVAGSPNGPFLDGSTAPLECGETGAIDPSPFVDANGNPFLTYKTERPARIWSRPLTPDGLAFAGPPSLLLAPSQRWEAGNVEAPSILRNGNSYWLFYSGNHWDGRAYAQGIARCTGPLGPCSADGANPALASRDGIAGPGGGEVFTDGSTWWVAYHAYREPLVRYPNSRLLHFARITFDGRGRPVINP